jgi:hypothetical protein
MFIKPKHPSSYVIMSYPGQLTSPPSSFVVVILERVSQFTARALAIDVIVPEI